VTHPIAPVATVTSQLQQLTVDVQRAARRLAGQSLSRSLDVR
jgi:hypothetical protein